MLKLYVYVLSSKREPLAECTRAKSVPFLSSIIRGRIKSVDSDRVNVAKEISAYIPKRNNSIAAQPMKKHKQKSH